MGAAAAASAVAAPRTFTLVRDVDVTGVSGTGAVAWGVQFPDGTCAMRWASEHRSTALYESIEDLIAIHGHGGSTRLEWGGPQSQLIELRESIEPWDEPYHERV